METNLTKKSKKYCLLFMSFILWLFANPEFRSELCVSACFFGLACVWCSLENFPAASQKKWAFTGFSAASLFHLRWLITTDYHGFYIFIVWIILALIIALQYTILSLLVINSLKSLGKLNFLVLAGFWIAAEISRELIFSGFPFSALSLSLVKSPYLLQVASVFGCYGSSGLIVLFNLFFFKGLKHREARFFYLSSSTFVLMLFFGVYWIHFQKNQESSEKISVALIQPGWAPEDKVYLRDDHPPLSIQAQWKQILSIILSLKGREIDVFVLPECAVSYGLSQCYGNLDEFKKIFQDFFQCEIEIEADLKVELNNEWLIKKLSSILNADIIVGLDYFDFVSGDVFNAAVYFPVLSLQCYKYFKQRLVPMGEYLPITGLHYLAARYGLHAFYSPGKKQIKFPTNKAIILPTVCYEECFGHFFRNQINQEVDLVVNLTNDAWFLPSNFSNEHRYLAQFRAVENGRWIARSCNTGVTCTIDPNGRVVDQLPVYDAHQKLHQGVLVAEIPMYKLTTLYYVCGDFFVRVIALLSSAEILRKYLVRKHFRS